MKKYAFGTCVITSVGMLGYEHVYAPIPRKPFRSETCVAFTNVPLIITVGSTIKKAVVVNGEVKVRDVITVTITLDHRYTDGARAAPVYQKFVKYLRDPESVPLEAN